MNYQWYPGHMTKARRMMEENIKLIDLVIEVVDARIPMSSRNPDIDNLAKNKARLILLNKSDLSDERLNQQWIDYFAQKGVLCLKLNSRSGAGIKQMNSAIERACHEKIERDKKKGIMNRPVRAMVVGIPNVGKSTLVNRIIKRFTEEREDIITTSHFPGTTLDIIEIPLDDFTSIIDTPGIINEHQLAHYVTPKVLKEITPKKEIKAGVYQLNPEQTLYIGGLARMDFVKGERTSFITHFSNALHIHRTKLEKADQLWKTQAGQVLKPIVEENGQPMVMEKHVYRIGKEKTDVVISGLGWITLVGTGQEITVHAPKGVGVLVRPSLI